jgi:hypothetical protein
MTSAHARLHDKVIRAWLAAQGWEAEQASLYDEEGVEGWTWGNPTSPYTFTTTGDWHGPAAIPDDLMALAEEGLAGTLHAHSTETA